MFRAFVRLVVLIVVLVAAGAYLLGWWGGRARSVETPAVGTTGRPAPNPDLPKVDTDKAREAGAKVGETVAAAGNQAQRALAEGSLTAKIKAKMALDDSVKALDINVDTSGTTVTLTGVVGSEAQRQRAVQLAKETNGVMTVIDKLTIK
jgi:hypothetical protein